MLELIYWYNIAILWTIWLCANGWIELKRIIWGARGVMVIIVGNGHGDTSSNPGRDWLHFT